MNKLNCGPKIQNYAIWIEKTQAIKPFKDAVEYSRLSLGSCLVSSNFILSMSNNYFVVEIIDINTLEESIKDDCGEKLQAFVHDYHEMKDETRTYPGEENDLPAFFRKNLSLNLEYTYLAGLASSQSEGSSSFCLPNVGII
ncbi:hypothetical protein STEG23_035951, partial [Scotinomys teguina]